MQGAPQDAVVYSQGLLDTPSALWLLGSLASFYRRPFDAALVLQRFAPPFDFPAIVEALEALEALGLKAGLFDWPEDDWSSLPLPAVVFLPEAEADPQSIATTPESAPTGAISSLSPALIVKHGDHTLAWVRPGQTSPEPLSAEAAGTQCLPLMLLVAEAEPPVSESTSESSVRQQESRESRKPFGFSWFVPELLRHKTIWRDVLLASLAIQLVGLATPLFTQVIIDKVIAHHSESTLIVLGVALVFACFLLVQEKASKPPSGVFVRPGVSLRAAMIGPGSGGRKWGGAGTENWGCPITAPFRGALQRPILVKRDHLQRGSVPAAANSALP